MTCHSLTLIELRFDLKNLKSLPFSIFWKVLISKPSNYLKFSEVSTYKLCTKKRRTTIQLIFKLEVCILSLTFMVCRDKIFSSCLPILHFNHFNPQAQYKQNPSKLHDNIESFQPKIQSIFFFLELANTTRLNNLSPCGNSLTPNLKLL